MSAAELVGNVFATWGKGGYNSDDALKTCQEQFSADFTMDWASEVEFKNTDINKIYYGPSGVVEFCRRLTEIDFGDFTPTITPLSEDKCLVKATYKPTVKISGKTADKTFVEYHEWTTKDGMITSCKVAPTNAAEFDALHLSKDEATGIVGELLQCWGLGKLSLSNEESKACYAKLFNSDLVTVADCPAKNTDGFKTYVGIAGFSEWITFLEGFEFPDYTIIGMSMLAGNVVVQASYTPTFKATGKTAKTKCYDMQAWTIVGGKISAVRFFFGNVEEIDDLFVA